MDKRKSVLNISVSIVFKIVIMFFSIIVKRFLIRICGNDVNGLNSLYLSIIGFLSVAELGVGEAITFCMYKPIVEGDNNKVSALYYLFNRVYHIVGCIVLVSGLILTPFLRFFSKDYGTIDVNMYSTFVLMLISVVITYAYGAKSALINAHKNNYITTTIGSSGGVLQYSLQIIVLLVTKSFECYLICRIVSAILQGIATNMVAQKKYSYIIRNRQNVDGASRKVLAKNIKAMFMHKIGYLLVNTVDSIIISAFVGVVSLGEYSNYNTIIVSITSIITLFFSSITSILGHLYAETDKDTTRKYCEIFHVLNFVLGTIFYLGYYATIDSLIAVLFSTELVVSKEIPFVITINAFIQFLRRSIITFKDATGTFYNDRWKPLIEGTTNIVLSICFVNWFGVSGVIVATITTNLIICHVIEPYVLYKNVFFISPANYYIKNYGMILLFSISLLVLDWCMIDMNSPWGELLVNGCLSVGISVTVCAIVVLLSLNICKSAVRSLLKK